MVRKQLGFYAMHLSATRVNLQTRGVPISEQVISLPCFLITNSGRLATVSPGTLRSYFDEYLDVPANSHRRFLRTELLEMGHPVESIDALMGHWSLGEEPWRSDSSFSFRRHTELLQQNLVPLIASLGFGPLKTQLIA
jgi:DNA-binding transcriptional MerR regulator